MKQYIDKDTLVAEIKRKIKNINLNYVSADSHPSGFDINKKLQDGISKNLQSLLFFIDTLEVKEVDLEKEIELVKGDYEQVDVAWNNDFDFLAKHFFELGMAASNKVQKGE